MLEPTGTTRGGRLEYRLTVETCRQWRSGLIDERVCAPSGYVTDFASIPDLPAILGRWGWAPDGPWRSAAIIHDWLYSVGIGPERCSPIWQAREAAARWRADRIFRRLMIDDGVAGLTADVFFAAVRAGGARAFGRPEAANERIVFRYWIERGWANERV